MPNADVVESILARWQEATRSSEPAALEGLFRILAGGSPAALEFAASSGTLLLRELARQLSPISGRLGPQEIALAEAAEVALAVIGKALPEKSWQALADLAALPGRLGLAAEVLQKGAGSPSPSSYVTSVDSVKEAFAAPQRTVAERVIGALVRALLEDEEIRPFLLQMLDDDSYLEVKTAIAMIQLVPEARHLLFGLLNHRSEFARLFARRALGLGDDDSLPEDREPRPAVAIARVGPAEPAEMRKTYPSLSPAALQLFGGPATSENLAEKLSLFVASPEPLRLEEDPELSAALLDFLVLRLGWASSSGRWPGEGRIFGELQDLSQGGARIRLLHLSLPELDLWPERRLLPTANLLHAWSIARWLVAETPTTFWLLCSELASEVLQPPTLEPGEIRFGPQYFGFRLAEGDIAQDATDLLALAAPSHQAQLWLDQNIQAKMWLESFRTLSGRRDFMAWPFLMRPIKPFSPRPARRENSPEVRLEIWVDCPGIEVTPHFCGKRRSNLPSPICPSCQDEMLCIFSLDGSDPLLEGTPLEGGVGDWDVFLCTGACEMFLGGYFTRPLPDGTIEVTELEPGDGDRYKEEPPNLPYTVYPVHLVPLELGREYRSFGESAHDHRISPYLFDDKTFHLRDLVCPNCGGHLEQALIVDAEYRLELRYTLEFCAGNYLALCVCRPCHTLGYFAAYD